MGSPRFIVDSWQLAVGSGQSSVYGISLAVPCWWPIGYRLEFTGQGMCSVGICSGLSLGANGLANIVRLVRAEGFQPLRLVAVLLFNYCNRETV